MARRTQIVVAGDNDSQRFRIKSRKVFVRQSVTFVQQMVLGRHSTEKGLKAGKTRKGGLCSARHAAETCRRAGTLTGKPWFFKERPKHQT